jgi:hypothetical protein
MRYLLLVISIILASAASSYSQDLLAGQKDSTIKIDPKKSDSITKSLIEKNDSILKYKMNEYKELIKKADKYEAMTETELKKTTQYKMDARSLLDSANSTVKKAETDTKHAKFYLYQFNYLIDECTRLTVKADSTLLIAQQYKDTANTYNKNAESYYFKIAEEYKPVQGDSSKPVIYVIQLGAGDMSGKYFEKIEGVEPVTPSDGIKRFIVGRYNSKEAALEIRQKMIEQGFTDAFIRTLDSLKY